MPRKKGSSAKRPSTTRARKAGGGSVRQHAHDSPRRAKSGGRATTSTRAPGKAGRRVKTAGVRTSKAVPRKAGRKAAATKTTRVRARARRQTLPPRRSAGRSRMSAPRGEFSANTRRVLWIDSPDQHAERHGQTLATRSHEVIRQWAEERGAVPATVPGTERDGRPGVLRFDFPDFGGSRLRAVDWDEWFETFDERRLVFLFQEQMTSGRQSNFSRLDNQDG